MPINLLFVLQHARKGKGGESHEERNSCAPRLTLCLAGRFIFLLVRPNSIGGLISENKCQSEHPVSTRPQHNHPVSILSKSP